MPKLTLNRVFAASLLGLLGGLGLLLTLVFYGVQNALIKSAQLAQDQKSAVIAQSVTEQLGQAPAAVDKFGSMIKAGIVNTSDPMSLRNGLMTLLLGNEAISEATFTYAKSSGFDADGKSIIEPATVGQVDLFRGKTGIGFADRETRYAGGRYVLTHTHLYLDGHEDPAGAPTEVASPASHLTFVTPTRYAFYGDLLWSDLHWFAADAELPEAQRRVEVSVQEAMESPPGQLAGVLRIGLLKEAIDRAIEDPPSVDKATDTIFLCVNDGHLIALPGSMTYALYGDDVRLSDADAPQVVKDALGRPKLRTVTDKNPLVPDQFVTSGTTYLCTFRMLATSRDWIVGIAVPRRSYLEKLVEVRTMVLRLSVALVAVIALMGLVVLQAVSRAHSVILKEAARMNDFMLERSHNTCNFRDIDRVLASIERAKTAMRSMGRYVPLDLVRRLYHKEEEPTLGGEATELSVLFTDIQGFTAFAETVDGDTMAARLGSYLEVMVSVIQREKGTIDKFIGDSVMAFWNAPETVDGHAALACRAALKCQAGLEELYASKEWEGAPGFATRFGLHRCVASVGHFGAPERFNYTAIGDGINLASRLEGLNKHYGTWIIASGAFREAAGEGYVFRRLDRVAVKGKSQWLDIYELIGEAADGEPGWVTVYEEALEAYLRGEFERALEGVEKLSGDGPSIVLAERCRVFIERPPVEWGGVYVFDSK